MGAVFPGGVVAAGRHIPQILLATLAQEDRDLVNHSFVDSLDFFSPQQEQFFGGDLRKIDHQDPGVGLGATTILEVDLEPFLVLGGQLPDGTRGVDATRAGAIQKFPGLSHLDGYAVAVFLRGEAISPPDRDLAV